jgi:acetoin utilization deacetylase AcuC-like enzyme
VKVVYSPRYEISLPGHIWPTSKYRLIADRVRSNSAVVFVEPEPASWEDLALVHTPEYLHKLRDGGMTMDDIATLELPWQPEMADGFRLMVGGTIHAARAAVDDGLAAHLSGGLHHAFANHGEGFCPVNDVAVAVRVLGQSGRSESKGLRRAAIVDLDVHHGNGTSMIFGRDEDVFTFSMHQQLNYPFYKPPGDLDIGMEDGTRDMRYLELLSDALPRVLDHRPDIIFYLAGADPYEGDRLGGLRLTKAGLAQRDRVVVAAARAAGVPLVTVLAGGYAADVEDTVDIHVATIEAMSKAFPASP